jgi:hypothetical protein
MKSSENPRIPKMEIFDISKTRLFFSYCCKKIYFFVFERKINFIQRISYKYLTKNLSIRKYCENIVKFFLSLSPCLPFFNYNEPISSRSIRRSGIPENHTDNPASSEGCEESAEAPASSRRRLSGIRSEVPTLARLINDLERIWERTERLKDTKSQKPRSNARALILSTMRTLEEQVAAIHPDLAPKRTKRYYSKRDLYIGNVRRGDK